MGSTTSLEDTGLLDEIVPLFELAHPDHDVRVVAVGTGEALELGRRRDVDVVLVHAPPAELEFVRGGYGHGRTSFLRNDFVIAGPEPDPARVRGLESAPAAFRAIARAAAPFTSRGDGSGTHIRELEIWREAGEQPTGPWYVEVGQGMGATLQVAGERRSYALSDRASLVTAGRAAGLEVLVQGDTLLRNIYSVIEVSGAANPEGARAFARWISSPETVARMAEFGRDRFGASLFLPLGEADAAEVAGPP